MDFKLIIIFYQILSLYNYNILKFFIIKYFIINFLYNIFYRINSTMLISSNTKRKNRSLNNISINNIFNSILNYNNNIDISMISSSNRSQYHDIKIIKALINIYFKFIILLFSFFYFVFFIIYFFRIFDLKPIVNINNSILKQIFILYKQTNNFNLIFMTKDFFIFCYNNIFSFLLLNVIKLSGKNFSIFFNSLNKILYSLYYGIPLLLIFSFSLFLGFIFYIILYYYQLKYIISLIHFIVKLGLYVSNSLVFISFVNFLPFFLITSNYYLLNIQICLILLSNQFCGIFLDLMLFVDNISKDKIIDLKINNFIIIFVHAFFCKCNFLYFIETIFTILFFFGFINTNTGILLTFKSKDIVIIQVLKQIQQIFNNFNKRSYFIDFSIYEIFNKFEILLILVILFVIVYNILFFIRMLFQNLTNNIIFNKKKNTSNIFLYNNKKNNFICFIVIFVFIVIIILYQIYYLLIKKLPIIIGEINRFLSSINNNYINSDIGKFKNNFLFGNKVLGFMQTVIYNMFYIIFRICMYSFIIAIVSIIPYIFRTDAWFSNIILQFFENIFFFSYFIILINLQNDLFICFYVQIIKITNLKKFENIPEIFVLFLKKLITGYYNQDMLNSISEFNNLSRNSILLNQEYNKFCRNKQDFPRFSGAYTLGELFSQIEILLIFLFIKILINRLLNTCFEIEYQKHINSNNNIFKEIVHSKILISNFLLSIIIFTVNFFNFIPFFSYLYKNKLYKARIYNYINIKVDHSLKSHLIHLIIFFYIEKVLLFYILFLLINVFIITVILEFFL